MFYSKNKKEDIVEKPRPCPFCSEEPFKERSFYTIFSKYVYWCGNEACRLGKTTVKFWYSEWQGK